MAISLPNMFRAKLTWWMLATLLSAYFIVSIDTKIFSDPNKTITEKIFSGVRLPNINLGIDLRGGTHLVIQVEIEKALEKRLFIEMKQIDKALKHEGLPTPIKKDITPTVITYDFADAPTARKVADVLKQNTIIKASATENCVKIMLNAVEETRIRMASTEQSITVLRNRLDGFNVRGLIVQQHGERKIVVQLPGLDDSDDIKSTIMKTASLEFKLIEEHAGSEDSLLDKYDGYLPNDLIIAPSGKEDGEARSYYAVSAFPDMTGEHIIDAALSYDEYHRPVVSFKLDSEGARDFRELTGNNIGRKLGILLDGVVITAPSINSEIGGQGIIQGKFTPEEASRLAALLKSGALLAPLTFEQENRVGSSLGQDSIRSGIIACLVALFLLFIFALFYYRLMGLFAIIALLHNLFLVLLFLSYFKATLTLLGIAGMVLTIGMAIDASILIYEKIREELGNGNSLRAAVHAGFDGVMTVILDSNITTFLTGVVLFQFGGPAIRGFAVTLMIGVCATVLSGVYFLRALIEGMIALFNFKKTSM